MNGTIVEPVDCGKKARGGGTGECWENELALALRGRLREPVTQQLWRLVV